MDASKDSEMTGYVLVDTTDHVHVLCPICRAVHTYDGKATARTGTIVAQCVPKFSFQLGEPITGSKMLAALNTYNYELERKRKQYYARKEREGVSKSKT